MLADSELREQILDRLRGEGLVLADDPCALARLEGFLHRVKLALPGNALDDLDTIFVFRESDQREEFQGADGWLWWFDGMGKTRFALGVSIEVLEGDQNYAVLVVLHELAHLRSGQPHNACFSGCLDVLINQYNKATGEGIENDYSSVLRPDTVGRMDDGTKKIPKIGQKRRGLRLR